MASIGSAHRTLARTSTFILSTSRSENSTGTRQTLHQGSPEVTAQQGKMGLKLAAAALAWPALLRKAHRLDPDFAS